MSVTGKTGVAIAATSRTLYIAYSDNKITSYPLSGNQMPSGEEEFSTTSNSPWAVVVDEVNS